ncbi:ABC transporter substrate-binding protein [Planctomicrobium sp. SH664]|uniref:ABC transporter substrate-binding protein n=1 Tax=Planctomicrobium sp. SH664 TaxID=3448125 RepID=UPI003F5CB91F
MQRKSLITFSLLWAVAGLVLLGGLSLRTHLRSDDNNVSPELNTAVVDGSQPSGTVRGKHLSDGNSRQVTDLAGRQVNVPQEVHRVVLMRGMGLYDLSALLGDETADRLVGWDSSLQSNDRDAYERFTERFPRLKEIPLLGDSLRNGVSAEAILALQPDLIIGGTYMLGQTQALEQLERAGVPIVYLSSDDPLRDPQASLLLLGEVFHRLERAREIVDWVNRELATVLEPMQQLTGPVCSIYVEAGNFGAEKYGNTFGSNQQQQRVHWGSLLHQLRCDNIGENVSGPFGMGVIQPEYLLTRDPEVIVITGACWTAIPESLHLGYGADRTTAVHRLSRFADRPGWSDLRAVQTGRLYGLNTRLGSHIMSFVAVQQLAQWLYPAAFPGINPQRSLQEFHERFMPIPFSGQWMVELKAP